VALAQPLFSEPLLAEVPRSDPPKNARFLEGFLRCPDAPQNAGFGGRQGTLFWRDLTFKMKTLFGSGLAAV
jgi:hypothetical protein